MSKSPKQVPNCIKRADKCHSNHLQWCLLQCSTLMLLPFHLTIPPNESEVPEKLYHSWSVTVYIKKLSSQDNLTAQIEPMQDKTSYLTNYRYKSTLLVDEIDYTNQYRGYYWSYYNLGDKYNEIQHLC